MIISATGALALSGLAAFGAVVGARGSSSLTKATSTHADHDTTNGTERAFYAPGIATDENGNVTGAGTKPYWRCNSCCSGTGPSAARYSLSDKTTPLTLEEVTIPSLTAADSGDVFSGDQISAINTKKFKYVDQGASGADASSDGVESAPWYVKDSGKTAVYFSRSGKTGDPVNPKNNNGCSEFRFTVPESARKTKSASFSYKYKNWGTGVWKGNASDGEPADFSVVCQFKDTAQSNSYVGTDVSATLINDGEWHTLTVDYKNGTTGGLTDFIFKFAELRGYIMISGLSYHVDDSVTIDKSVSDIVVGRSATIALSSGSATSWSSSDETVATVDNNGNVTTKKIGSTIITATGPSNTDTITINVVKPTSIDTSAMPSSYKASLSHVYDVPVTHTGVNQDNAYDFALNSSIALKDSDGNDTEMTIPTMKLTAAEQMPGTNSIYKGFCVKFNVATTGIYSIFTNGAYDEKIHEYWTVAEDGTISSSSINVNLYENGSTGIGKVLCGGENDAHCEIELIAGTYIVRVGGWSQTQDMNLGIVKVTSTNESASVASPVVTATGDSPMKTVTDSYALTYIPNTIVYDETDKNGFITVENAVYPFSYDENEGEYSYFKAAATNVALANYFSWNAIVSDANWEWVETKIDYHSDLFHFDMSKAAADSPVFVFMNSMGLGGKATDVYASADYTAKTVTFGVSFTNDDENTDPSTVTIETATESPITVNGYDVIHGGEAGSDSGIDDNWGE